jgi:hypothetical protein
MLEKNLQEDCYVNVFSCDDKKKDMKRYNFFYNLKTKTLDEIYQECFFYNVGTFGSFVSLNPLTRDTRKKEFVKKINFVFIDLDNATEDDFEGVKTYLDSKGFVFTYTAKTGGGYHIVLSVNLENTEEIYVKNFLNFLHTQISSKVDISTGDMTRLIRVPESTHFKKDPLMLDTLSFQVPNDENIKENTLLIQSFKIENKLELSNQEYQQEIKREDVFFSSILQSNNKWDNYKKYLDKATQRNNIFLKNLGIFLRERPKYKTDAVFFIDTWEKSRNQALEGWIKKASDNNMRINYLELLKWCKDNNIKEWEDLLQEQLKTSFLDAYELYFLEEEKKENSVIVYFTEKDYYVQKSMEEVILNIFYDCKEKGLDLVEELNLKLMHEKWEEFTFKKQMSLILDQIRRLLEQQNRVKLIYNLNYKPDESKFITENKKRYYNIYKPSPKITHLKEPTDSFDFSHIKELILNLCGNDEVNYDWFIQWLAFQIQNPLVKLPTATIFQGEQGTGKGVFKTHILDWLFGDNCQEINQTHLESPFNEYLLGKQMIIANEVMHNENRQTLPNILKNIISDEHITIQRKFRKDLVIRNYTHWIFCTNSDNPIKIEEDDRRYSVFKSKKLKGGGINAQKFVKELIENKPHELPHFLQYLKTLEVDEFLVTNPLETEAKKDIQELNKNSLERFLDYLREWVDMKQATDTLLNGKFVYMTEETTDGHALSTDLLYLIYEAYCEKYGERGLFNKLTFAKKLKSKKIESSPRYFTSRKSTVKSILLDDLKKVITI